MKELEIRKEKEMEEEMKRYFDSYMANEKKNNPQWSDFNTRCINVQ